MVGPGTWQGGARTIAALVRAGARRHTQYRGAMIGGAAANTVFGLLRASLVSATIVSAGGRLGGYAVTAGVTYVWITQALIGPVEVFTWDALAARVRSGDIAVDLARPVDLQVQYGAEDAGRALARLLPRSLPPLTVGALTFGLDLPGQPWVYLAGAASVALAVAVSFACRYLVGLSAFWLLDARGVATVYVTVSTVLCGLIVPVHWFPAWLATLVAVTPFPSMLQAPADILTGRAGGSEIAGLLSVQLGWLIVMVALGQVVQRAALRRLVVQGG